MNSKLVMRARLDRDAVRRFALASVMTTGLVALVSASAALDNQSATQIAQAVPQAQDRFADAALRQVAHQHGLDVANLTVVSAALATYPLSGASAHTFKVLDSTTGAMFALALNAAGQQVEPLVLELAERNASDALYGRLEPQLAELLPNVAEGRHIAVTIWLNEPMSEGVTRLLPEEAEFLLQTEAQRDAYFAQIDAARAGVVAPIVEPVAAKLDLAQINFTTDSFTPVIHAFMTPAEIRDVATWGEVDRIYAAQTHEADLDVARQTINAHIVNGLGITGSGIKVAQIEVGGRVAAANPFLAGVTQDGLFACSTASGHSTAVAGMIRSTHASVRGIAYNCSLYAAGSCGGISSELQSRSTAAANWGASAMNLSWGSNIGLAPGADDKFYDGMVINRFRTVVKSAGNQNGPCGAGNGNVTSPGLAYNVITVGNFDDRNTVSWLGDSIEICSSYRDPSSTHGDREKPEVAAPGTNFTSTTTAWPWTGGVGSGTSYSAPLVTGTAALMMQRNSSLTVWPESVKAILMATATHNIEGATRLSEYDGAGGIVDNQADNVVRRISGNWGGVGYTCASAVDVDETSMYLVAGRSVRAVIAWDNDPAYAAYTTQPGSDLDLQLLSPTGTVVAGSSSWDNTYEIAEFTPSVSGTYKLRVHKFRCDYSPRYLGWAWYQRP